jgi:hypothetical protein
MFSQNEVLGPQNQVEANKEEDCRREHVPDLCELPTKRLAKA